jgi:hypothetical protein
MEKPGSVCAGRGHLFAIASLRRSRDKGGIGLQVAEENFSFISNVEIAQTIAALLGLDMKSASGHTIREIHEAPGVH